MISGKKVLSCFCAVALGCILVFPVFAEPGAPVVKESVAGVVSRIIRDDDTLVLEIVNKGTDRKTQSQSKWVAVPYMKIAVGDSVSLQPGAVLNNYHLKGVNRTFDTIIFSPGRQ